MEEINHEYTPEIVCPWCGCAFMNSWEISPGDEDLGLEYCSDCEKEFYATRIITVDYTTKKAQYGTCTKCNNMNVVIESGVEYDLQFTDLCEKCKSEHRQYAIDCFMKAVSGVKP